MLRTGLAHLPLHGGRAPRWLFERMVPLAREIMIFTVRDFGREEVLRRLSDPFWFQAFGSVLGFDWHSSGLTTTVCGAIKEGLRGTERELGIFVGGGKGAASRRTPAEITAACERTGCEPEPLVRASRGHRSASPPQDSAEHVRARARRFRVAALDCRCRREDAAGARAHLGAHLRDASEPPRSGALCLRPWRQGRHTLPCGPRNL
jgi:hypothetical protein